MSNLNLHGASSGHFLRCCCLLPWSRPSPWYNNLATNSPGQNPLWELFRDTVHWECSSLKLAEGADGNEEALLEMYLVSKFGLAPLQMSMFQFTLTAEGKMHPAFLTHLEAVKWSIPFSTMSFRRTLITGCRSVHVYKTNDS